MFMDDAFVHTKADDEDDDDTVVARHAEHLTLYLQAARKRKLQFKLSKCRFGQLWIKVLGFMVGEGCRKADPAKVEALRSWPNPTSLDDIVSFRAFANFVKEFIPTFQEHGQHLRPYTKKGARFAQYLEDKTAQSA